LHFLGLRGLIAFALVILILQLKLLDPEQVRKDNTWDDLLEETLRVISI